MSLVHAPRSPSLDPWPAVSLPAPCHRVRAGVCPFPFGAAERGREPKHTTRSWVTFPQKTFPNLSTAHGQLIHNRLSDMHTQINSQKNIRTFLVSGQTSITRGLCKNQMWSSPLRDLTLHQIVYLRGVTQFSYLALLDRLQSQPLNRILKRLKKNPSNFSHIFPSPLKVT